MMKETDILIIGGGPAGIVAGTTARKNYPTKKITLVREKEECVIPCGIPYIFNRLDSVEQDLMLDTSLEANKIDLLISKAIEVDSNKKEVLLENNDKIIYEKLILSTGSSSSLIPIKNIEKEGVWYIKKDFEYLKKLREAVLKSENIVIIGGGFIGVELAEELSSIKNLKISIVERMESCLSTTFDNEFTKIIEDSLKEKNIQLYINSNVEEIGGNNRVEYVKLEKEDIPADLVIVSVGAKPNVNLAEKMNIEIGEYGGIKVDDYMKTNIDNVFAIGDCAETKCLLTNKIVPVMLASTACHEARIAAANLYEKNELLKSDGTLSVFSTSIYGMAIGIVGLSEKMCEKEKIDIVVGESEAPNHHPGTLPNTKKIKIKLIFSKDSSRLLGGQIIGPESVGEMINVVALAIQKKSTIYNLDTLQIASHPLLTSAPTVYPIIAAAQSALTKIQT